MCPRSAWTPGVTSAEVAARKGPTGQKDPANARRTGLQRSTDPERTSLVHLPGEPASRCPLSGGRPGSGRASRLWGGAFTRRGAGNARIARPADARAPATARAREPRRQGAASAARAAPRAIGACRRSGPAAAPASAPSGAAEGVSTRGRHRSGNRLRGGAGGCTARTTARGSRSWARRRNRRCGAWARTHGRARPLSVQG